jgi:hypothetical protein
MFYFMFYFISGSTNLSFTVILRVGTETTTRTPGTRRVVHQECDDDKQGIETRLYDAS